MPKKSLDTKETNPSIVSPYDSGFKFSVTSLRRKSEAHPDLQRVLEEAIKISKQDFSVGEAARTKTRQAKLVATGKSQTLRSRHLVNPANNKAYACDLYAIVNGEVNWDNQYYYEIASAIQKACKKLNTHIVWGGNWNVDIMESNLTPIEIHKLYKGKLHDLVHFELSRKVYPDY